jgi:hypothetical protein
MNGIYEVYDGSITGKVLTFNPDAIPEPDTLHIRMTRGERRIADELRKSFGGFERVIIDVDGEQHEFSADSLVQMLEYYEDAQGMNNHMRLFGTPERAAWTLIDCNGFGDCVDCPVCHDELGKTCEIPGDCVFVMCDYAALLDWLKGGTE